MVKVKFCGLKRPCDIAWANELRPDYAGFVFAGKKRRVSDDQAAALRKALDPSIPAVGVFVDDSLKHIGQLVTAGTIQIVQLHGCEDDAMIEAVQQTLKVCLMIPRPPTSTPVPYTTLCRSHTKVLRDHGAGGTGDCFDWALLAHIDRPYFLAGGLNPDNAAQAAALQPFALDVSSGIETDGVKDKEKMKRFMAQVRAYRR